MARARASESGSGADWIYTYLRSYYRDGSRETGWNNAIFPNVGMPNPLWHWQGMRGAVEERVDPLADQLGFLGVPVDRLELDLNTHALCSLTGHVDIEAYQLVLLDLPSAVLLPYDGRDGFGDAAGRHRDGDAG